MENINEVDPKLLVDKLIERKIIGFDDMSNDEKRSELTTLKENLAAIVGMDEGDSSFSIYVEELEKRLSDLM